MSRSADIIVIRGLSVDTVIGVYGWEREVRQTLVLDIEMAIDNKRVAAEDNIDNALDYAAVSERVTAFVENSSFELIETLAEQVAGIVMAEFNVPRLKLCVSKPGAVANAKTVGIHIERGT